MVRRKRNNLTAIGVSLDLATLRDLSELSHALDRGVSEIAREMILNDLPRFKDKHRRELRDAKRQAVERNTEDL